MCTVHVMEDDTAGTHVTAGGVVFDGSHMEKKQRYMVRTTQAHTGDMSCIVLPYLRH